MTRVVTISVACAVWMLLTAGISLAQPSPQCPEDVGAAVAAACPCDADGNGAAWRNHGKYVSCVVRYRNGLRRQGCLDLAARRTIARCAARSTCGKADAVLCCYYDSSATCSDVNPGNATAEGVCSHDATVACDTSLDCVTVRGPKVARDADACTARGGTAVGGGSVCSGCPAPTAP